MKFWMLATIRHGTSSVILYSSNLNYGPLIWRQSRSRKGRGLSCPDARPRHWVVTSFCMHFVILRICSNHLNTWLVWYLNGRLCPVVKWFGIQMVVWKPDWKSLFMVGGKRNLRERKQKQLTASRVARRVPYCLVFRCPVFRWLLYFKCVTKPSGKVRLS